MHQARIVGVHGDFKISCSENAINDRFGGLGFMGGNLPSLAGLGNWPAQNPALKRWAIFAEYAGAMARFGGHGIARGVPWCRSGF